MERQPLLIELGCEDLPARYVRSLAQALAHGLAEGLQRRQIDCGPVKSFATPRRLAALIGDVAAQQPDQTVERRGPSVSAAYREGQPTAAALGFARSCGVDFDRLQTVETEKGAWLVHRSRQKGQKTRALVAEIFADTLQGMDELVPKRMRWGTLDQTFVRPVQWLLCLLGKRVVPLEAFGLRAGAVTYGHRFHAPGAMRLAGPEEYESRLRRARVWADFDTRRSEIRRLIEIEAQRLKGRPRITEELLDEVTALVEWPVVVSGRIEERFLGLPTEVVIATVETNQRYFPVFAPGDDARLLPSFITVANIESRDLRQVVEGNERVVRPRLTDAMFFWEQDRRQPLEARLPELDRITWQKALGSVGDKARRVTELSGRIARSLSEDPEPVTRAARLCKADLVTRMVFEFPELQGTMGGYYARHSGESGTVAEAIASHYRPIGAGSPIPSTRPGQLLAVADKLDTLAGIFVIGLKPTASKDPFALRRATLGILRICIEAPLPLALDRAVDEALNILADRHASAWVDDNGRAVEPQVRRDALRGQILDFLLDRLRGLLLEQGIDVEVFNAVAALGTTAPADFAQRVRAVQAFLGLPESARLAAAHKRIRNILKQASDGAARVVEDLLREGAERDLHQALLHLAGEVEEAAARARYQEGLKTLARLQAPVDNFFERVMVMDEDPRLRGNRVALLRQLDGLCRSIADISCLPG